jgi:four helix bundle protein
VTSEQLRERTQIFASSIVRLCIDLRTRPGGRRIADQLEDSATSTAANYRAVCRAHTRPTFIAKLSIVVEEADETLGWLETLERAGVVSSSEIAPFKQEANELVAIFVASRRTAGGR